MTEDQSAGFDLAKRVHDMVRAYVLQRTESKCGISWDSFKDKWVEDKATGRKYRDVPGDYRRQREAVCREAFLAMRTRRSREDFVSYFTGTICAVPQWLPESEYLGVAGALLAQDDTWNDTRSLAMLTLSALSRV